MASFTPTQGRYLAFIKEYTAGFGEPPAESEIAKHLEVSPPSVNQMLKMLESKGLISRIAKTPRSIEILIPPEEIPDWKGRKIVRIVRQWTQNPSRSGAAKQNSANTRRIAELVANKSAHPRKDTRRDRPAYCFKITLTGVKPPIWRRIETLDVNLAEFHGLVQLAMGWTNSHMHQFIIDGVYYSEPMMDGLLDEIEAEDSTKVSISDLVAEHGSRLKMKYEYDFGDGWMHEVKLEKVIQEPLANREYPRCVAGARACPPEDIGGSFGYMELLDSLENPDSDEAEYYWEAVGEFNPDKFDPKRSTRAMQTACR